MPNVADPFCLAPLSMRCCDVPMMVNLSGVLSGVDAISGSCEAGSII